MRSTPVAHRGSNPGSHEFRVRFSRRLRGARLVPAAEPLAPTPAAQPPVTAPAPQPANAAVPPPAPAPQPVLDPAEFWKTVAGREMQADRARIDAVLGKVTAGVASLRTEHAESVEQMRQLAAGLALTLATRLLHEQVEAGTFAIENKVRDMTAQLEGNVVTVRLNPADLALLNQRLGGEPLSPDSPDPRFVPDPNLGRGDCQVEGRESMLLSDVSRELDEIRDELLRSLKNARS